MKLFFWSLFWNSFLLLEAGKAYSGVSMCHGDSLLRPFSRCWAFPKLLGEPGKSHSLMAVPGPRAGATCSIQAVPAGSSMQKRQLWLLCWVFEGWSYPGSQGDTWAAPESNAFQVPELGWLSFDFFFPGNQDWNHQGKKVPFAVVCVSSSMSPCQLQDRSRPLISTNEKSLLPSLSGQKILSKIPLKQRPNSALTACRFNSASKLP